MRKKPVEHFNLQNTRVIRVTDEHLTIHNFSEVSANCRGLLDESPASRVVVDLQHVKMIDSVGVGLLERLRDRATRQGSDMVLACREQAILDVFDILNMRKFFIIHDSVDDAVK